MMNNSDSSNYERVKIHFELECRSKLQIGSGESSAYHLKEDLETKFRLKKGDQEKSTAEICMDIAGNPYIPATSLRGYLSRQVKEHHLILFGAAREVDENDQTQGGMGVLRVYDARYKQPQNQQSGEELPPMGLSTRTAIDPITGVAKKHHLITQNHVNKGVIFNVELECDRINEEVLLSLLDAIKTLNGSPGAQLGKGKTLMKGLLQEDHLKVEVLQKEKFIEWLTSDNSLDGYFDEYTNDQVDTKGKKEVSCNSYQFHIKPTSPILVNDIHEVSGEKGEPDHVFMSEGDRLLIPSSTLKGLLKAHCRKILLTMMESGEADDKQADDMLDNMFGSKDHIGWIRMSDSISSHIVEEHEQTFIAIDRFTGGASTGALYQVKAACVDSVELNIHLDKRLDTIPWAYGLLYLVLRDAMEGDLRIGWGKAKGYGAFRLTVNDSHADQATLKNNESGASVWIDYFEPRKEKIKSAVIALEQRLKLKEQAA